MFLQGLSLLADDQILPNQALEYSQYLRVLPDVTTDFVEKHIPKKEHECLEISV